MKLLLQQFNRKVLKPVFLVAWFVFVLLFSTYTIFSIQNIQDKNLEMSNNILTLKDNVASIDNHLYGWINEVQILLRGESVVVYI